MTPGNRLYYGDNLDVLREHIPDEAVDLVYLDPPFNSNRAYNVIFARHDTHEADAAQIQAFDDTWRWTPETEMHYQEAIAGGVPARIADALSGFRTLLGENDAMAYLVNMAPRLVELHRVLKPTGSLYLHCDPTMSHYLKVLLDAVFRPENFRNEIVWRRTGSHNSAKRYGPIHDILLFYGKTQQPYFQRVFRPYLKGHVDAYFKKSDARGRYWTNALTGAGTRKGLSGQPWRGYNPTAVGRHWAIPGTILDELGLDPDLTSQEKLDALDEAGFVDHPNPGSGAMPTYRQYLDDSPGMSAQDIWAYQPHTAGVLYESHEAIDEDVRWLGAQGDSERLGYPTQKPCGLLERVIASSCPPDGIVLDPFCGCGTTVEAAQKQGRPWVGIDITYLAIDLIEKRLRHTFGDDIDGTYSVDGIPRDVLGAEALFEKAPLDFERWAVSRVNGTPNEKQVGDRGIDGVIRFFIDPKGGTGRSLVSVKGGKAIGPQFVRDLLGAVETQKAQMGLLVTITDPTRGMKEAANRAGTYTWPVTDEQFPRVQLLTVAELFSGKRPKMPATLTPYIKARRFRVPQDQLSLGEGGGETA